MKIVVKNVLFRILFNDLNVERTGELIKMKLLCAMRLYFDWKLSHVERKLKI